MKKSDTHLRPAATSDLGSLNSIMHESSAYAGRYRAMIEGYRITPDKISDDHFYLAEKDGVVLGFYALVVEPEPELDLFFISDNAQGLGLGRILFEHMLAIADRLGLESIKIVSHPPSVGFYLRMGARQTGVQPPSGRVSWERPVLRIDTPRRASARTDDACQSDPL